MWGFTTAILVLFIRYLSFDNGEALSLKDMIISFIVFPIAGYFWGVWTWKISQKKKTGRGVISQIINIDKLRLLVQKKEAIKTIR